MPFLSADDPLLDDGEFTSSLVYGLAKPRLAYPYMYDDFFDVGFLNNIDSYHITYDDLEGLDRRVIPAQNYDFINYVANHKKYSSIQSALSEIGDNPEMSDIELLNIGRKCKAALVWASESGVRVHFILDDIDMDEVVRKLPNTRPPPRISPPPQLALPQENFVSFIETEIMKKLAATFGSGRKASKCRLLGKQILRLGNVTSPNQK